jgi:hypothetical protein
MSILAKVKREKTIIGLVFVTLVIVTSLTFFFMPLINESIFTIQEQLFLVIPSTFLSLGLYLVLPIIFCSIASLLLHPKRVLSPIYVQIALVSVIMIMVVYRVSSSGLIVTDQSFLNLVLSYVFSLFFWGTIGWLQLKMVGWIVMSSVESMDQVTYSIDESLDSVLKCLKDDFFKVWRFREESDKKNVKIFKRSDDQDRFVVIAIGSESEKSAKTIIATVAFQVDSYVMRKTKRASAIRDSIINDIKGRLKFSLKKENQDFITDDFVSSRAYIRALDLTKSKFEIIQEFWKNIPKPFRIPIYITVGLFLLISFLYSQNLGVDSNTYVTTSIALFIAVTIELGIPLIKDLVAQKKLSNN